MESKFIRENVYRVKYGHCEYQHYSANTIEEAISMCKENYPNEEIYSVELIAHTRRRKTKTVTIDV